MPSMPKGKVAGRCIEQPIALLINESQRVEDVGVGVELLVPMDVYSISHDKGASWHEGSIVQRMIFQRLAQWRNCELEFSILITHK